MTTDQEWEKWGQREPYFGVLTQDKFRRTNLGDAAKQEFFESGRSHVNWVFNLCQRHFDPNFSPKRVLDFGCGVGRLVIPLAEIADSVVGVDVSESMLQEARQNCQDYSLTNVKLLKSDDSLSTVTGEFDFIHSFIVFQHIPVSRGKQIFDQLLQHLTPGGLAAIHVTYEKAIHRPPLWRKLAKVIKAILRTLRQLGSLYLPPTDPELQMNPYPLNDLFLMIQSLRTDEIYVNLTDHGGELGVYLVFRKPQDLSGF